MSSTNVNFNSLSFIFTFAAGLLGLYCIKGVDIGVCTRLSTWLVYITCFLLFPYKWKLINNFLSFKGCMSSCHWTLVLLSGNRYQNKWSGYFSFTWLWSITNLISHYWGILDSGTRPCFSLKLDLIFNIQYIHLFGSCECLVSYVPVFL